ncbi:PiggyBac transposable element-derived protein 3 [Eumeta japonica]|uniref:PiggyBac transposable element-derived protein 3 n=1 Tax=Eumeta variegata TaxID=151549 RepID=A0A4C1VF64_EUMVA|nr:PiggyBac transposable element-derived protein 3 [Eumeta japonica]
MFSRDAIIALEESCLSDLELSSDDEGPVGPASERELRCVRVGADIISRNQREIFPPALDDDDDEDAGSLCVEMSDDFLPEVPSASEDTLLQNITPKHSIRWRHKEIVNTISPAWFPFIAIDPRVESPVDYYSRYVPKQLFQVMAEMTNLYATYSNKVRFKPTTAKEIEILFGLHLATGIFGYPCLKMYWETNISIPLFTENMARDRFFELRNNLHLVDNTATSGNSKDAFIKVRPIFDAVRKRCLDLPLEKNLCVDEQIVPFTGKHVAKQYIKGKPCPWGLKIFFLYGKHGQAYDFILYQSSSPELDKNLTKKIGYGAAVVLHLTKRIGESKGHQLYFDNYFSFYHLLQILKQRGIMAAGTIRINRFVKPSLLSDKEMNKKPRGFAQEMTSYDEDVTVVKWMDNKITHLASNFVGIGEKDLVKRWCKKDKHFIEVERPEVVRKYNHAMG